MFVPERSPLVIPAVSPLSFPADLEARLGAIGVTLSEAARDQVSAYLAQLLAMNALMNLTAIEDPGVAWEKHALDALALVPLLPPVSSTGKGSRLRLIDIGSGGGLPGIPLAIARPDVRVMLVEATQKKASFLSAVSAGLGLDNVEVRAERAEDLARGELADKFDVVTARAVARLSALLPLTAPFAKGGGLLLLVKGQRADEELAEAKTLIKKLGLRHEGTRTTPTGRISLRR